MARVTIEIDKSDIKRYGVKSCINYGMYSVWTENRIRSAFNFGQGTEKDFEEHKRLNSEYCAYMDVDASTLPF